MHFMIAKQLTWPRSIRALLGVDIWGQWEILVNALWGGWCQSNFAQLMPPQALLCADVWWFLTTMGPGSIVTQPISAVSPRGLSRDPRLPQTLAKEASRSLFSYRILLQVISMNLLDEVPFSFVRRNLCIFFPYWIYFVSIAHVYCKPVTNKHILLRLSGVTLRSSDICHPFLTMGNLYK